MTEWSFSAKARAKGAGIDAAHAEQLAETLPESAVSFADEWISATFTVEASTSRQAAIRGIQLFQDAIDQARLPPAALVAHDVKTFVELEAELAEPNLPEMVGVAGVAEMLGVTKQRASQLANSDRFPRPVAELNSGRVWLRASIESFNRRWTRKPGRAQRLKSGELATSARARHA